MLYEVITLEPGNAELLLHHFSHVVDRTVAHDEVEVGRVGALELVDGGVAGEGGDQGDPAALEQILDDEGVAADSYNFV